MVKTAQFNLRMDVDIISGLTDIAETTGISTNALAARALTDYVQIYHYKIQRGDITLSKPIIKKIFEKIDPSEIEDIAEYSANFIVSEIRVQEGKPTYEILLDHFMKWNKGRLQFNRIPQDESDLIVAKHSIGRNWSELQCKIYAKCFELIGETIKDTGYDFEDSYYIEVVRHSNS